MFNNAFLSAVVCACLGICRTSTSAETSTPPHIIFILADDVGWNDVSFHGSRQIPTPNIDALAATGVILQRHYSASTCTPSRTAVLASVYPARTNVGYKAYPPASEQSLSLRFELLPQWLKRLGYSTHLTGKWHLGYSSVEHTPTWRGFDTFFGYYNFGGFYFNHSLKWQGHCGVDLWHNVGHSIQPVTELSGVYSTHAFTRHATQIIADHDLRKPLFLFFSHQGIHATCDNCTSEAPRENTDKFAYIEQPNRTVLAGALDVLDESVGRVLAALQERDMLAHSVVVFASDNGAGPLATATSELPNAGNNWPLRGTKDGAWEGGVRTTALLWSASLRDTLPRPPSQQVMHTVDWGPTLYAVAGGNVSELGDVDGQNLWHELSTGEGEGRHEALLQLGDLDELSAIISGRYKLLQRPVEHPSPLLDEHVALPQGLPPADLDLDALMRSSDAWKALQAALNSTGGLSTPLAPLEEWRDRATVQCHRNADEPGRFDPHDGVFMFDIVSDPCETDNIASSHEEERDKLLDKLSAYRVLLSPEQNDMKSDERGFPEHHECLWSPWVDVTPAPYQKCSC